MSELNVNGCVVVLSQGQFFTIKLPDGSELNVEQTQDDFSIVDSKGIVLCSKPIAKL